jgi:hypothetical protein
VPEIVNFGDVGLFFPCIHELTLSGAFFSWLF